MGRFETIKVDDALPELRKKPGVTQLVKYSAGGGDFNPLHHDYNFEYAKAIGSIIVHGRFKYAALGELVSNWLAHEGRIKKISCEYKGMDMPDNEIICNGRVSAKDDAAKEAELELWTENDAGKRTTLGSAVVAFS